ncbi:HAUS augmin-like complex subunit 2 isoform X1 [Ptychodera flava]|uniref:HAUS augmin-like complex subunit 2 isoform X1 n=1 Tax=Ptychodera flava TaxID=63121 RepID=UPI00396A52BE
MTESFLGAPNPWISEEKSLGALGNVLSLAERTGHLRRRRENEIAAVAMEVKENSPSLHLIQVLKGIENKRKQLYKVDLEVNQIIMDKATKDITHLDILERRIGKLNELSNHLQSVIKNKDTIINRLQQPTVGEGLKIEATHHKFVAGLFPMLAKCLAQLNSNLDNIDWIANLDLSDGQLDRVLNEITTTLAQLQSSCQTMLQMRDVVGDLHRTRLQLDSTMAGN